MKRIAVLAVSVVALTSGSGCKKLIQAAADAGPASVEPKQSTPVATGTTFTKKAPTVGMKLTEESTMNMTLQLKMLGKDLKLEQSENQKKDEEVLEVTGDTITKLKVTYTQDDKTESENGGKTKTKATPINGKTYILSTKDGKTVVHTDKDKPAPKNEEKLVTKDFGSFGKPDPFTASIPDRALNDGEDVPELANAIRDELLSNQKSDNPKESLTIDSAKVTFKGKDGDVGTFDVSLNMKGDAAIMKMSMPLTGKMSLRTADSFPTLLDLSGPINLDLSDKDKSAGVSGQGTIAVKSTFTYK